MNPAASSFDLQFRIAPIILTGGIAGQGGQMPITALLPTAGDLDNAFATFKPLPGATLADNAIGEYPFANQAVAANAIIANPLTISLIMVSAARPPDFPYSVKFAIMSALRTSLAQHSIRGGTYVVMTPSGVYDNCILTRLSDISRGESNQPQYEWQWDFKRPLISLQEAQQAQNTLVSKMTSGAQITPNAAGRVTWQSNIQSTPPT